MAGERSFLVGGGLLIVGLVGTSCGASDSNITSTSSSGASAGAHFGGAAGKSGAGGTSGSANGGGTSGGGSSASGGAAPRLDAGVGGRSTGDASPGSGGRATGGAGGPFTAGGGTSSGPDAGGRHPNVLLVLDKSGSTQNQPVGFNVTIWEGMKSALSTVLDGAKDRIAFGLDLFPALSLCQMPLVPDLMVPVEDGATGVPKIVAALIAATPGGGSPTAAALGRAYDYYTTGTGMALEGDKYVLLATDGGPNCNPTLDCNTDTSRCTINIDGDCTSDPTVNCCVGFPQACLDDQATLDQINKLASAGIRTLVVGIPGSEVYASLLDTLATAGHATNPNGPPLYYRADTAGGVAALTKVFTDVTNQIATP